VTLGTSCEALRERNFRLQFVAASISMLGSNLAPVAIAFAILDLTGSASALGAALAARALPTLVFSLAGGVWADRLPRHRVMVAANLAQFGSQALFAALLLAGRAELWQILLLQAAQGAANAFLRPATTGLTAQTVKSEHRQQANALLSLSASTTGIAGPVLAGVLVVTVGSGWAVAADAATFAVSAALLSRISLPTGDRASGRAPFLRELADGWRFVRTFSWVWLSIGGFMVFQLLVLSTFFVLGPAIAERSLGGASAWALIVGAAGAGSLLGDLLALRWEPSRPLQAATLAGVLAAPALLLLALESPLGWLAAAGLLLGIAFTFPDTLWFATLQEHVPEPLLARVSAYDWAGSLVLRPIGYAIVGPLAAIAGAGTVLVVSAVLLVVTHVVLALAPSIRRLPRSAALAGAGSRAAA
jgi:predicted MFS family arabinose efflux permease